MQSNKFSHFIISNVFPISSSWISGENGMFFAKLINWLVLLSYCRILHPGKYLKGQSYLHSQACQHLIFLVKGGYLVDGLHASILSLNTVLFGFCCHLFFFQMNYYHLLCGSLSYYYLFFEPLRKNHIIGFKLWKIKRQK